MVIALASRSYQERGPEKAVASQPVGLWARRGSSPFPGAILMVEIFIAPERIALCAAKEVSL